MDPKVSLWLVLILSLCNVLFVASESMEEGPIRDGKWANIQSFRRSLVRLKRQEKLVKYTDKYDRVDYGELFKSQRYVTAFIECLLGQRWCPPEGKTLKLVLQEALQTNCAKCTDKQKEIAGFVVSKLRSEYKTEWALLTQLWDKSGRYQQKFEKVLNQQIARPAQVKREDHYTKSSENLGRLNLRQPSRRPVGVKRSSHRHPKLTEPCYIQGDL